MSEPITNVPDAVAVLGALPVPQGPEPQALSPERLAEIRDRAVYLHSNGVDADEYELELSASVDVPALLDEVARVRRVLREACDQIARLESELGGASARVAALEAERHVTNEALDDAVQELRALNAGDAPEVFVPQTERSRWVDIAAALNAAHDAGMPVGIDLDGTLTDHNAWSVVWVRETERWAVAGYDDEPDVSTQALREEGACSECGDGPSAWCPGCAKCSCVAEHDMGCARRVGA